MAGSSLWSRKPGILKNHTAAAIALRAACSGIINVKKCTRKCTARNNRVHDEGSGMEASEWSLRNEGLGMEPQEWSIIIMRYRRMMLPCGDAKNCI